MLLNMYKYIFKEIFYPFILGVVLSTFVLLMFQIIRLTEFFIVQGVSLALVFKLFFYMIVSFLPITIPISFLFSILLTFNRMSSDNEIVALKSCGVSIYQLLIPVNLVSVFIFFISLYVNFFEGPWGNKNAMNLLYKISANKAISRISEGFLNSNIIKDLMFYSKKIDNKNEIMHDVFIYNGTNKDMPFLVRAKTASLFIDEYSKSTSLTLNDGDIIFLNLEGLNYRKGSFSKFSDVIHRGSIRGDRALIPPSMDYYEIKESIENENNVKKKNELLVEYNRRLAVPFACIIFGFLGVGFGSKTNRRTVKAGAGILSFIVLLSYWFLYVSFTALGIKGSINSFLSAWLPNIIFTIIAIYMIKKAN